MAADVHGQTGENYSLSQTKRHKPCLIYLGHRYVQDKIQNQTVYWRCEDRAHCNGRAHQVLAHGSLPILTIKHNHSPIVEDLSRHDIITVDSHRRRQRQNQKLLFQHLNEQSSDEHALSKIEFGQCSNQSALMKKLQQFAEVPSMATTSPIYRENAVRLQQQQQQQYKSDPLEMNKFTVIRPKSNKASAKIAPALSMSSAVDDQPSRMNRFSWEEIEGRYVPVIFRKEKHGYQRYTSKMYVEHTLFQSASWQRHIILARSLPPLVSYTYTDAELKLFRFIVEWHLASVQFKTIPASDCLIRFEELLNFYQTLRQFRENISSTSIAPQESAVPPKLSRRSSPDLQKRVDSSSCNAPLPARIPLVAPSHPIPAQPRSTPDKKQSGWIQINNIFLPYIVKNSTAQHEQNIRDREYYIPYEILVKCHILSTNEYPWKNTLIKASQTDFDLLNHLITDINIFDEKVPEKTLLVNLYHIMVGIERLFYVKFLPNKQPRTQVNKYHSEVLKLQGGTLMIRANQLVPYILQNNRFYVPLYYTCESMPTLLIQARRSARAPRQYEVDYLNLILLYFSIETSPFTSDTLLVDIFNIKCSSLPSSIHFRTLQEQQQFEKKRLFTSIPPTPKASKSAAGSSTHKSPKQPLGQVMINPLIHHPSFYGLTSPALPPPIQPMRAPSAGSTSRSTDRDAHSSTSALKSSAAPEIKTVMFHQHSFSGIVRSPDLPVHRWKISLKQMCKRLSPSIEYEKFLQWCQTNSLVPLLRLDEDERKVVQVNDSDDFYIYHEHFDRCLDLLNDLQHGSIGMTLLPSSSSLPADKISFAGAKKRKNHSSSTTRHKVTVSTDDHVHLSAKATSPELPLPPPVISSTVEDSSIEFYTEDDDKMPVVVTVEGEQSIDEVDQATVDSRLIVAETNDGDEERIRFDDTISNDSSSGYESVPAVTHKEVDTPDQTVDVLVQPEEPPASPPVKQQERTQSNKSRARSHSSTSPRGKKPRSSENLSPSIKIITMDCIEQHLRTLSTWSEDKLRAHGRSVKTPARLLEEIPSSDINASHSTLSDTSICDVPSSSTTMETLANSESMNEQQQHSCTYNVMISNSANKLGLTIKKVLPQ